MSLFGVPEKNMKSKSKKKGKLMDFTDFFPCMKTKKGCLKPLQINQKALHRYELEHQDSSLLFQEHNPDVSL